MFNVVRTFPAPKSLSAQKSYREADVVEVLRAMFHDKCYLCELKDPTSLNVEHFEAHQGDLNKKFDWKNLYFVCGRCNNIKLARADKLLDCADPVVNVFEAIKHLPPHTPYQNALLISPMFADQQTQSTAELLSEIFNGEKTINKKVSGSYLRKNVFRKYNRLLELINEYFDEESSDPVKAIALDKLKTLMGRHQEHSAFLRWVIREDEKLSALLTASMD